MVVSLLLTVMKSVWDCTRLQMFTTESGNTIALLSINASPWNWKPNFQFPALKCLYKIDRLSNKKNNWRFFVKMQQMGVASVTQISEWLKRASNIWKVHVWGFVPGALWTFTAQLQWLPLGSSLSLPLSTALLWSLALIPASFSPTEMSKSSAQKSPPQTNAG